MNQEKYEKEENLFGEVLRNAHPQAYLKWLEGLESRGFLDPRTFAQRGIREENKQKYSSNSLLFNLLRIIFSNCVDSQKAQIRNILNRFLGAYISQDNLSSGWRNPNADSVIVSLICGQDLHEIKEEHIKFLREAFANHHNLAIAIKDIEDILIPKLLDEKEPNKLFNLFIENFLFSNEVYIYDLENLLGRYLDKIIKKGKCKIIEVCEQLIPELGQEEEEKDYFWDFEVPKILPNLIFDQHHFEGRFLVFMLQKALLENETKVLKKKVSEYLKKEKSIFPRIAIFLINNRYQELKDFLWQLSFNPFNNSYIRPELNDLFLKNQELTHVEVDKVVDWVEGIKEINWLEDKEQNEEATNYYKQLKLALFKKKNGDFCNEKLKNEFHRLREITGKENFSDFELSGKHTASYSGWVNENDSEYSEILKFDEQLKQRASVKKVLEFIRDYIPTPEIKEKLLQIGKVFHPERWITLLLKAFEHHLKQDPSFYIKDLKEFLEDTNFKEESSSVDWHYNLSQKRCLQVLISSLIELNPLRNLKDYEINELLNFLDKLVDSLPPDSKNNLFNDISQLASSLVAKEYLDLVKQIILKCAEKTEDEKHSELLKLQEETFSTYLNLPRGKILDDLMRFFIKEKRLNENKQLKKDVLDYFQKCLDNPSKSDYSHLWSCLGFFLLFVYKEENEFFVKNIVKILPLEEEKEQYWYASFMGYSFNCSHNVIDLDFAKDLLERGHYKKALTYVAQSEDFYNAVASHIVILSEHDVKPDLIDYLIKNSNKELFSNFLWQFNRLFVNRTSNNARLKEIWKLSLDRIKEKKEQDLIKSLFVWISLIEEIDDGFKTLILDTAEIYQKNNQYFDPYTVFPNFKKLADKSPFQAKFVGEIWYQFLRKSKHPFYASEDVKETLKILLNQAPKEGARIQDCYQKKWDIDLTK
jgi:HEPN domain-containing protein